MSLFTFLLSNTRNNLIKNFKIFVFKTLSKSKSKDSLSNKKILLYMFELIRRPDFLIYLGSLLSKNCMSGKLLIILVINGCLLVFTRSFTLYVVEGNSGKFLNIVFVFKYVYRVHVFSNISQPKDTNKLVDNFSNL